MRRIIGRLIFAAILAGPWWVVLLAIADYLLPHGWGVAHWWGTCLMVGLYVLALALCNWGLIVHERILAAKRGSLIEPGQEGS